MRRAGTGSSQPCWHDGSRDGQLGFRSPLLSGDDGAGGMGTGPNLFHSTGLEADQHYTVHRVRDVQACPV